ncbi:EVE domain-containing protein [Sphingomonas sp. RB3P16]|uniref:EVE domain-containing protein n=1 Tax=Parasphingomonas frigoris TaxID=3096163 RepID=UPI002FC58C4F
MAHWLLKSEHDSYGWDDLRAEGTTEWTGVRNAAAALHLKAMRPGDHAFFYHSGKPREIVGTVEIVRAAQQDGDDPRWVSVAIAPRAPLPRPVTLAQMKAAPALAGMALLRQSRLSVSPVRDDEWATVLAMSEGTD